MPMTALRKATPPQLSSARLALAERIAALNAAETEHANIEAALNWNGAAVRAENAAREGLEAAQAAVETAKQAAADRMTKSALAGGSDEFVTKSVSDARAAVATAEDELSAALETRKTLTERLGPAESAVRSARLRVDEAVNVAIREHIAPHLDALYTETDLLYRRAAENSNLLRWLTGPVIEASGPKAHPRAIEVACRFTSRPDSWACSAPGRSVLRATWQTAAEALRRDAGAELPAVVQ